MPVLSTDEPQSPIRAVYLEQQARRNEATQFKIRFRYATRGVWFEVKPGEVRPADLSDPELRKFTSEGPHIAFTPEMRALSEKLAGSETNPYLKAQKFYDWIAENIKYSFAIEYSTIRNIARVLPEPRLWRLWPGGAAVYDSLPSQRYPGSLAIRLGHDTGRPIDPRLG